MLTSISLQRIKTSALRRRVWFKRLSKLERSIIDLTIRCVKRVQSKALTDALSTILNKLLNARQGSYLNRAEKIGREIAEKACQIAVNWGNKQASTWKNDLHFIRFLGVNTLNTQGTKSQW